MKTWKPIAAGILSIYQRSVYRMVPLGRAYQRREQPSWDYAWPDSYSWRDLCHQAQGLGSGGDRGLSVLSSHLIHGGI
jgi:hypothetical protein